MIHDPEDSVQARAIQWHLKLREADDATWEAFAEWLAQNPSHAQAYDDIERMDQNLEALLPGLEFRQEAAPEAGAAPTLTPVVAVASAPTSTPGLTPAPAPVPAYAPQRRHASRWRWPRVGYYGGALAASLVALAVIAPRFMTDRYDVVTGPGQHQVVKLDETTEISLNGSTRVTLDRRNPRYASLVRGEALFRVRHDSARPFSVWVGGNRVEDVGTVFDVVSESDEIRVSVAEGDVIYRARGRVVPLGAGQGVVDAGGSNGLRLTVLAPAAVGAWQDGHLVYAGERLSQVAADLERSLGVPVAVDPAIAGRSFSGAIVLQGTGAAELNRLAPVLNVSLAHSADGWTLTPIDHEAR